MPLKIVRDDITRIQADAIVNAANQTLLGGGGVDGAIHRAAGPELLQECRTLNGCEVGQAKITKGYQLPARYVIHTVGPIWRGGNENEEHLLRQAYQNSLKLARQYDLQTVAFPLISTGVYGYPRDAALKIANAVFQDFLKKHEMTIILVIFDQASFQLSSAIYTEIQEHIDEHYVKVYEEDYATIRRKISMTTESLELYQEPILEALNQMDKTFTETLLQLIDEKQLTDVETYKKANIDRRLFSKIRNDIHYKPSKPTAIALAIAMELTVEETNDLLQKAGYTLSNSDKFDVIIQYFIMNRNYNIFEINEALFAFKQKLLGV